MANGNTSEKTDNPNKKPEKSAEKEDIKVNLKPGSYSERYKKRYSEYFKDEKGIGIKPEQFKRDTNKRELGKQDARKSPVKIEEDKNFVVSRQAKRIEKIIITLIYIAVILVAIYFILVTFFPEAAPFKADGYEIKASDSKIFNTLSSFYIDDQSVLGEKNTVNNIETRLITSSKKFNFIFAPKENIPAEKKASFNLDLVLNQSTPGAIYLDDNLIFPDLSNYELIKQTTSDYIYAKKELVGYMNKENFVDTDRTEDFLYANLPGANVWSTRQLGNANMYVPDYKIKWTSINTTFRENLKLAVYTEDSIDMDFVKQDLNGYIGQDEYIVNVKNSLGQIIYTDILGDDGDKSKSGKLGPEQKFSIYVDNLDKGIYYITFEKDKYNDASDSTIKNIEINTNKILIMGNFLPISPFKFYTKTDSEKKIGFYYWHAGKEQIIDVSGTKDFSIDLNKDWLSKRYDENFTAGHYTINCPKGDLWVFNDISAPSEENWFDFPFSEQEKFDNPDIIIVDRYKFDKDIGIFSYSKDVDISKLPIKVNLRTLEANSASLKDARIMLK